jgi:hypothetical protein
MYILYVLPIIWQYLSGGDAVASSEAVMALVQAHTQGSRPPGHGKYTDTNPTMVETGHCSQLLRVSRIRSRAVYFSERC